jgi:PAS domain S-box-containing protein
VSLVVMSELLFNYTLPVEDWLARTTETVGWFPVGHISPLTAWVFALVGLAFLLEPSRRSARRPQRQAAALLALATLLFGLMVALGYVMEVPLLYGSALQPMSALSAVAFILLGLGWLTTAEADVWPVNLFRVSAAEAPADRRFASDYLALAFLMMAIIGTAGWYYFKHQQAQIRHAVEEQLTAIADLKVKQISGWHQEWEADVRSISESPAILTDLQQSLVRASTSAVARQSLAWMSNLQARYHYQSVALFDARGDLRLCVPATLPVPSFFSQAVIRDVAQSNQVVMTDLHRDSSNGLVHMSFFVPVGGKAADGPAEGLLRLQINADRDFFPMVQSWPTPSHTAETLLLKHDGSDVRYVNELRHRANTALRLGFADHRGGVPVKDRCLECHNVSAKDRMQVGPVETNEGRTSAGQDYRGVKVLGIMRKVPGTPWFLVVKMDQSEAYAPLRQQARIIGMFSFVLMLAVLLGILLLWRHQKLISARQEIVRRAEAAAAIQESEQRFRRIYEESPVGYQSLDAVGRLLEVNPAWLTLFGYTRAEVVGRRLDEFFTPASQAAFAERFPRFRERGVTRGGEFEVRHRDGQVLTILFDGVFVRDAQGLPHHSHCVLHNITERKQVEERFRRAVVDSPFPVLLHAEDGQILQASQSWHDITGYGPDELKTIADWTERAYGERKEQVRPYIEALYELDRRKYEGDYTIRVKDGTTRVWEFSSGPLGRLPDGRRLIISMALDVTERRRVEEELRHRNAELERFNQVTVGRELRMIELKRQVNDLARELGRPAPYPSDLAGGAETTPAKANLESPA